MVVCAMAGLKDYKICPELDGDLLLAWMRNPEGEIYQVTWKSCSCEDFHYRREHTDNIVCKHIAAWRRILEDAR